MRFLSRKKSCLSVTALRAEKGRVFPKIQKLRSPSFCLLNYIHEWRDSDCDVTTIKQ